MALKFKATLDEKSIDSIRRKFEDIRDPLTQTDANVMGKAAIKQMKALISRGISPIKGPGIKPKFEKYKNPKSYPGKRKPKSPVNLRLTGKFLANLKSRSVKVGKSFAVQIGYSSQSEQIKEKGHRERAGGQPSRPTIPKGSEQFAVRVQDVFLKNILKIHRKIAKRRS